MYSLTIEKGIHYKRKIVVSNNFSIFEFVCTNSPIPIFYNS